MNFSNKIDNVVIVRDFKQMFHKRDSKVFVINVLEVRKDVFQRTQITITAALMYYAISSINRTGWKSLPQIKDCTKPITHNTYNKTLKQKTV